MNLWERASDAFVSAALMMAELLKRSGERIDHSLLGLAPTERSMLHLAQVARSTSTVRRDGFTLGRLLDAAADAEPSFAPLTSTEPAHSAARSDTLELLVGIQMTLSAEIRESDDFQLCEQLSYLIEAVLDAEDRLRHGS